MENLANNARDQGFPGPGPGLRDAFPDRVDVIEDMIAEDDTRAFPGRNDRITGLLAEGDKVWMQFNLRGTHQASFYGLPPTARRVEMPEIGIIRVVDGKWVESWYFGDELGMLLQLGAVNMLQGYPLGFAS